MPCVSPDFTFTLLPACSVSNFLVSLSSFLFSSSAIEGETLKITQSIKQFNPLTPKSDKYLNSPYNNTPESHVKVKTRKEIIIN